MTGQTETFAARTTQRGPGGHTTLAVVQDRYGSPDSLTLTRIPKPAPGAGEVLVRVHAASVNARDWHIMRGEPRLARLLDPATFGPRGPRVSVRGTDVAGIVEAVGEGVTRWKLGDRVFGEGTGTFAEHALARDTQLATIPSGVAFDLAAALPLAATTAALCINAADPVPGSTMLIIGASGGVGTFAIQLAKARQLHVTAVVSTRNREQAESLGADRVIDYTTDRVAGQYDVVVDLVGNRSLRELSTLVRPDGALVLSGGGVSGHGRILGPLKLLIWAQLSARRSGLRILLPQATPDADQLHRIADQVAAGEVTPMIDRRFPLEQAADAIRYLETEHARAKVVINLAVPTTSGDLTANEGDFDVND